MAADQNPSNKRTKSGSASTTEVHAMTEDVSDLEEPEDGGWGWFIALGSFMSHVLAGGLDRSGGVFYLRFLERYGGSAAETAWVTALFSSFRTLFAPLASAMVNRFSGRTVVFAGALLSVAGVLVSGYSVSLTSLYLSYGVCTGIGVAFTYVPGIILTGQYFNKRRGAVVGLASVGAGLGSFLFPPFVQLLFETYTFQGTYLLLSGIVAHYLVVGAFYRPLELHRKLTLASLRDKEKQLQVDAGTVVQAPLLATPKSSITLNVNQNIDDPRIYNLTNNTQGFNTIESYDQKDNGQMLDNKITSFERTDHISQTGETTKSTRVFDLTLLRDPVYVCLCMQSFLFFISFSITITFVPALVNDRGLTAFQGSTLISIMGISDAVTKIIASIVLDLKAVKAYRLYVFNLVLLITVVISTLLPNVSQFWHFALLCGIYGSLTGTYKSQWSMVIIDVVGVEKVSSGLGIVLGVNGLSSLISPTFGGFLKDSFGTYTPAFYFGSAGLFLSASVMVLGNFIFHRRTKNQTI